MKQGLRIGSSLWLFIAILVLSPLVRASELFAQTAYGRRAEIGVLRSLVHLASLETVVRDMQTHGVRIFRVPEADLGLDPAALAPFGFLEEAPVKLVPSLVEAVTEVGEGSGYFLSRDEVPELGENVILLDPRAHPVTLYHEFMHHLFEKQNSQMTHLMSEAAKQYQSMIVRFNFKSRKVMMDNSLLLSKKWRDEIREVIEEYVALMDRGQGWIASEEIAIELALQKLLIEEKSPHFSLKRAQDGILGYSQGLVQRSEGLSQNIFAISDLIQTEGTNQDPEATEEEKSDWTKRSLRAHALVDAYMTGPLARMKLQVIEGKKMLENTGARPSQP